MVKANLEFAEEPKLLKLDLACGQRKQEGFTGIDFKKLDGVDVVHDLESYPWPFEDESVDEVYCSHFIEHVNDLIPFMNELHRVMKPGAEAKFIAPYYTSMRAWQDPTHKRAISEASFLYFNQKWLKDNGLDHYPITADFDCVFGYMIDGNWATRSEEAKTFAVRHYWNVVSDIHATLTKRSKEE